MVTDSFTLSASELAVNKDGKPTSLGEIMKQIMSKFKVRIEASANQRTRQTTFHMKSESQKELDRAKRNLLALLSPVVRLCVSRCEFPSNAVSGYCYVACSRLNYSSYHRIQRFVTVCLSTEFGVLTVPHRCHFEAGAGANWSKSGHSS